MPRINLNIDQKPNWTVSMFFGNGSFQNAFLEYVRQCRRGDVRDE